MHFKCHICTHTTFQTETAEPYLNLDTKLLETNTWLVTPNTLTSAFNYTSEYPYIMFSWIYLCFTALHCTSFQCTTQYFTTLHYIALFLTALHSNAICAIAL